MAARLHAPTATERDLVLMAVSAPQQMEPGAVARKARKKYAYLAARFLTQTGMLAMAAFAVSPGADPKPQGLPGLLMLSSLVVAAYALTSTLRKRWEADGDPQQTG